MATEPLNIIRLNSAAADFEEALGAILRWDVSENEAVQATVRQIIEQVRQDGDSAVLEMTRRFDRLDGDSPRRGRDP